MREYAEQFPGVVVEERYLRNYPHSDARRAAVRHACSRSARSSARRTSTRGVAQGTRIGQSGLELRYDKYLRGDRRLPEGRRRRVRQPRRPARRVGRRAQAGPAAQADARLQPAEGRRRGAAPGDRRPRTDGAQAGAYVAMDPRDGAILAHGLAARASTRTSSPARSARRPGRR